MAVAGMLAWSTVWAQPDSSKTVYAASYENFPNPERGFYIQRSYNPQQSSGTRALALNDLRRARDEGMSLLRMYYVLSEFRGAPLSEAMLQRIAGDFATLREAGLKMIPRFAYNFGPIGEPDASAGRIMEHLEQLAPVLRANAGVIAFMEAGFVGTWGEWHSSTSGLFDPIPGVWWQRVNGSTRAIVEKLLDILPPDRMIALRYPRHKMDLYGPEPLSIEESFSGTPKARTGAHNDCFLASDTDWGTYTRNIDAEKRYYHQDNLFVPQGGETCNAKDDARPYIGCENALAQLDYMHYTTLNSGYEQNVLKGWEAGGCMDEIKRRLGYRFRLLEAEISSSVLPRGELTLAFVVVNEGWANLYNPRPVEIVLRRKDSGEIIRLETGEDPRRWVTGQTSVVRVTASIPVAALPGEYEVLLHLPDPASALRGRPEYAIRFANEEVWEPSSGMNALNLTVMIAEAGSTP